MSGSAALVPFMSSYREEKPYSQTGIRVQFPSDWELHEAKKDFSEIGENAVNIPGISVEGT
jgi:hypothetical protein